MMKTLKKTVLILISLILIFVAYTFISTGYFRTVNNHFNGKILKKIQLPGAEDLTVSYLDSFAIISSTDRAVYPPLDQEIGGLYHLDLKNEDFTITALTESLNIPFAPHGISILKTDSTYLVYAINHTTEGHSIEVFRLNDTTLEHLKTLKDETMLSPNDLVVVDEDRFYFTNDHGYTEGVGKLVEEYGGFSWANVIYFDGASYREVADGIAYANGINVDSERQLLFVASPRKFLIKVFKMEADGQLIYVEDIPCGTGIDNLELDQMRNIWIGGHPNLLGFAAYAKGKKPIAPSELLKITYKDKGDYAVESIYREQGDSMSASSVAVPFGNLILAGNVMDKAFLILEKD